jgi:hypothetical protein
MLLKVETNQVNDEYGTCIAVSYQVYEEKFHTLHVVNISNPHETFVVDLTPNWAKTTYIMTGIEEGYSRCQHFDFLI